MSLSYIYISSFAGKIVNIRHLDQAIKSINGWYQDRGLTGLVGDRTFVYFISGLEMPSV